MRKQEKGLIQSIVCYLHLLKVTQLVSSRYLQCPFLFFDFKFVPSFLVERELGYWNLWRLGKNLCICICRRLLIKVLSIDDWKWLEMRRKRWIIKRNVQCKIKFEKTMEVLLRHCKAICLNWLFKNKITVSKKKKCLDSFMCLAFLLFKSLRLRFYMIV